MEEGALQLGLIISSVSSQEEMLLVEGTAKISGRGPVVDGARI